MGEHNTRPLPLGDQTEHFWLVQRMARATGTDLVAASEDGSLTQKQWAELVHRCRGCQWTCGCERWLDDRDASDVRQPPVTCVNHKRLEMLRRDHGTETE